MSITVKDILYQDRWLAGLPALAREDVINAAQIKTIPNHTVIFQQEDTHKAFYGLLMGYIDIGKITVEGQETQLTRLSPVQWFGEMSFLDHAPRTHNATSRGDVTLAVIAGSDMTRLLATHNSFYTALVQLVCQHTRLLYRAVDDFMQMSPERMLARRVLELWEAAGGSDQIRCSQDELARLVGVSRQSINRILGRWEDRRVIERAYRTLIVRDIQTLENILKNEGRKHCCDYS